MPRERQRGQLLQVLGTAFGIAVIVGNSIGVGILRTPGEIAERLPSVPLFMGVWVVGGLYALLGALSLSELGAMIPRSGGQYVFVRRALGPYPGFVVGWSPTGSRPVARSPRFRSCSANTSVRSCRRSRAMKY